MNKKIIVPIVIIIIIIGVIFLGNKIKQTKIQYEILQVNEYNYFKYNEDGKFGIIDRSGDIIIEAKYKNIIIPNPEKDIFICDNGTEKNIVLNLNGEEIFSEYENIEPIKLKNIASILCYEKDMLIYEKDGQYGLIDFEGKEITKNKYDSIENLQSTEGKFLVSIENKYGVINSNGVVLIDIKYDKILTDGYYTNKDNYIYSGFIISNTTEDGYKYGYVDYRGNEILEAKYNEILRVADTEEIILIVSENGKYGIYKGKKELVQPQYESIIYDDNGNLIIQKNKKYGVMNLKGNIIIDTKYSNIEKNGIYLYAQSSNENVVYDKNGNKVDISFNKTVYETENEEYRVITILNNDKVYYGIESKTNEILVNPGYRYIEYLYKNYFIAKDDSGNLGVINSKGKVVIDLKYDSVQKVKDKSILQILNTKTKEMQLYSSDLKQICTMKDATLENEKGYIRIYNDSEEKFFDENGNEIKEDSELVQNSLKGSIPQKIKEYDKIQYSLDDVYFSKK